MLSLFGFLSCPAYGIKHLSCKATHRRILWFFHIISKYITALLCYIMLYDDILYCIIILIRPIIFVSNFRSKCRISRLATVPHLEIQMYSNLMDGRWSLDLYVSGVSSLPIRRNAILLQQMFCKVAPLSITSLIGKN